jgi:hypothetical protein
MKCPACGSPTTAVQTIPSDKRKDGRTYRARRCRNELCGKTCSTLEGLHSEVKASGDHDLPGPRRVPVAIPAMDPGAPFDLEGELEKGLPLAVDVMVDAVRPGTTPDRAKIDAAKWLIDDRRKWRIAMADQCNASGQEPTDPAVAQLANILRLVPDQEAG